MVHFVRPGARPALRVAPRLHRAAAKHAGWTRAAPAVSSGRADQVPGNRREKGNRCTASPSSPSSPSRSPPLRWPRARGPRTCRRSTPSTRRPAPSSTPAAPATAPPARLALREDLRTRLALGLVFEVTPLADADKPRALAAYARERGFRLSDDVIGYLLAHGRRVNLVSDETWAAFGRRRGRVRSWGSSVRRGVRRTGCSASCRDWCKGHWRARHFP